MKRLLLLVVFAALYGAPVAGSEILPGRLAAAHWCPVYFSSEVDVPIGCDTGIAFALWSRPAGESRRYSLVAVAGGKTVGAGIALAAFRPGRLTVGVAIGVIAPWDSNRGVDFGNLLPAVGATVGFGASEP